MITTNADHIAFLGRVRMTLEELEIWYFCINCSNFDRTHEVEFPKLKEISLAMASDLKTAFWHYWFAAIKAPRLRTLVMPSSVDFIGWRNPWDVINHHRDVLACFPSVQRIIITTPTREEYIYLNHGNLASEGGRLALRVSDRG
jgi:hypothetical protein